jgi:toxin ParE1/3/4
MASLSWSNIAKNDLREIFEYIARDSKYYAETFVKRIQQETKVLKTFPKIGRKVPETNNELIREIIFQNYRIIYKISKNEIVIATIFHSARMLKGIE